MGYNKELLSQIIDNLNLIKENNEPFSAITKDIVLQNLRDAYMSILKMDTEEVKEIVDNQEITDVVKEESVVEVAEKLDEVKPDEIEEKKEDIAPITPKVDEKTEETPIKTEETPIKVEEEQKFESVSVEETIEEDKIAEKVEEITLEFSEVESKKDETIEEMDNDILQFLIPEVKEEPKKVEVKEKVVEEKPKVVEEKPKEVEEQPKVITPEQKVPQKELVQEEKAKESDNIPQQRSLNDLFNEQKDNSLSTKFQQTKVLDLTKAISINDKFLFIRELFKNRSEEFSRAIQTLNNCETIEEAFDVMEGLKKHYFWDSTSSAYLTLCDLVRRKF